ncbi:MAG: ribosome small subunit-dependent GTPase A [Anaerolineae bacterium]|nr:ribosome small subunit-dependent GTPase A [Anaerolineae bacterium]
MSSKQQFSEDWITETQRNDEIKGAHRHVKPKRKPKRARQKDWWHAMDEYGTSHTERVMRRGEQERRAMVKSQALATLEAVDETSVETAWENAEVMGESGVVLEVSSGLCRVVVDGRVLFCSLRRSLTVEDTGYTNLIAVGDRVRVTCHSGNRGIIERVLPRLSVLARPDPFYTHLKQVIVANADQLLIVASWLEPPLWHELIDRYLIGAGRNRLTPVLCVNKLDLAEDREEVRRSVAPYVDLGYRVLYASARTGEGIGELRAWLQGKTTVLAGLSGVGKSSLLVAVVPDLDLRTGAVSTHWGGQGQHTTTQTTLFALDNDSYVVDTPGIREFSVAGLLPAELLRFYPEIAEIAEHCRFANCSHVHEPDCAVKAALLEGRLSATRYHNYRRILAELE